MSRTASAAAFDLPVLLAGEVTIIGGFHDADEPLPSCRIATNGDRTVLSARDAVRGGFRAVDAMTGATAVRYRDGIVEITGVSEELTTAVGLTPAESTITWRVKVKGCASCG